MPVGHLSSPLREDSDFLEDLVMIEVPFVISQRFRSSPARRPLDKASLRLSGEAYPASVLIQAGTSIFRLCARWVAASVC